MQNTQKELENADLEEGGVCGAYAQSYGPIIVIGVNIVR